MDIFSIIGPVMIGPSSSHTAGACKIGNIAALVLGKKPKIAEIVLYGSFAKTGAGHGTDKAAVAGILGYRSDDTRIKDAFSHAKNEGLEFSFSKKDKIGLHPNTMEISLWDESGRKIVIVGESIGGGRVRIKSVNDFEAGFDGENYTTIVVHTDKPGVIAYVSKVMADEGVNIAQMSSKRTKRGGVAALLIETDHPTSKECMEKINNHALVNRMYSVPKL